MQDSIIKSITVKTSQEKAYKAITDPKQLTRWFPDEVEGDLAAGKHAALHFGDFKAQIYVEAAEPFSYFAYRWLPGKMTAAGDVREVPNTLVEFFVEESSEGTKVTVKESGFASLPPEAMAAALAMNQEGWGHMMNRFAGLQFEV